MYIQGTHLHVAIAAIIIIEIIIFRRCWCFPPLLVFSPARYIIMWLVKTPNTAVKITLLVHVPPCGKATRRSISQCLVHERARALAEILFTKKQKHETPPNNRCHTND